MAIALNAVSQFFSNLGDPLSGGKVWTYAAGTTTPLASYTNQDGNVANANPVVLDAAGRAQIWLTPNVPYKIVVTDASDVEVEATDEYYAGMNPEQLTLAGQVPASGGSFTGAVSFTGGATLDGTAAQDLATLNSLGIAAVQTANLWINPDFSINQRVATSVTDAAYAWDRTVVLTESGSVSVTTFDTLGLAEGGYAGRMYNPDASAKKIGICQIVEYRDAIPYRGKNIAFAGQVRVTDVVTLRMALVAWTGTADAPTRDVVNNWASTNYTASNFFVANTTTIATAAISPTVNAWVDFLLSSTSPGGVVVPTTLKNLYMMVWTEGAIAQNVTVDFTAFRCGQGTEAPRWSPPLISDEVQRCQRYFYRVTPPLTNSVIGSGVTVTATSVSFYHALPVYMRVAGTASAGNAGTWVGISGNGAFNLGNVTSSGSTTSTGAEFFFGASATSTIGWAVVVRAGTVGNYLQVDSEI